MTTKPQTITPAEALALHTLVTPTEQGIASRVLARTAGGNLTLFAFDAGQELTEHTSPFDALVIVLEGSLALTIDGKELTATPGTIVRAHLGMAWKTRDTPFQLTKKNWGPSLFFAICPRPARGANESRENGCAGRAQARLPARCP